MLHFHYFSTHDVGNHIAGLTVLQNVREFHSDGPTALEWPPCPRSCNNVRCSYFRHAVVGISFDEKNVTYNHPVTDPISSI